MFGFTVCWLAIDASQGENSLITPSTVLWIIALPLFDSVCIMLRRLMNGKSPFNPDREHLHHIFAVAGYSNNATLLIILTISLALSITGITASRYFGVPERALFVVFTLLFAGYYWLVGYAWKIMKISRYIEGMKKPDRRAESQRRPGDQRTGRDRRYEPTEQELENYYNAGRFMAGLLRQPFPKNEFSSTGINIVKNSC